MLFKIQISIDFIRVEANLMTFKANFLLEVTKVTLRTPKTSKKYNFVDMGVDNQPKLSDRLVLEVDF